MKTIDVNPDDILPLTPAVFHILLALADGERHGYAIMQEVAESTNRQIKMGPGTLYGTIKRLLEAGLIEESNQRPDAKSDDERSSATNSIDWCWASGWPRRKHQRYNEMAKLARRKRLLGKVAGNPSPQEEFDHVQ